MSNLLLSTLAMMGLTFLIGFFVAGVIKIIANWADFFEFYKSHRAELLDLKRAHRMHRAVAGVHVQENTPFADKHRKLVNRLHETIHSLKPRKSVTA